MISKEDKIQCIELFNRISRNTDKLVQFVKNLKGRLKSKELKIKNGHKYLSLKNQLLLNYSTNLTHLMMKKAAGESIKDSQDIHRLVEIRTALEKMRPLEQKLKFELDKKINMANSENLDENHPLKLKPNPFNLVSQIDTKNKNEDSSDEESNRGDSSDTDHERDEKPPKLYRPPKLIPKFYDGDESIRQKRERLVEKVKKKAMSSTLIQDLQSEFTDLPQEISDGVGFGNRLKDNKKMQEKTEYEESYFTRMQVTKKEKNAMKRIRMASGLEGIGRFSDISMLADEDPESMDKLSSSKSKKRNKNRMKGSNKKRKKIKFH